MFQSALDFWDDIIIDYRFLLATSGLASFNTNAAARSLQASTIRHKIGHALGVGTLWEDNEVYNDGTSGNSNRTLPGGTPGQYIGPNGLAQERDPQFRNRAR